MHEMSLCENIISVLEAEAARQSFTRVKHIWIEVGAFSGAEPESMKFCFDAVSRGTIAEKAVFDIIATPGRASCFACGSDVTISERYDPCPLCGSHQLQVTGGEDLSIKELEVD
jgi:hydrogenase nickel incorporation protein HypA/HybF